LIPTSAVEHKYNHLSFALYQSNLHKNVARYAKEVVGTTGVTLTKK
jgi:hypothetical protein